MNCGFPGNMTKLHGMDTLEHPFRAVCLNEKKEDEKCGSILVLQIGKYVFESFSEIFRGDPTLRFKKL